MGVKYSSSESEILIETMSHNIQIAFQITERLERGSVHLISVLNTDSLQGNAYTIGKNLFADIIVPTIHKLHEAIQDIQIELESYKSANSVVAPYGHLDLEDLVRFKRAREKQLAITQKMIKEHENFINVATSVFSFKMGEYFSKIHELRELEYQLQIDIDKFTKKIEKLEWFVDQVSSYFTDSLEVIELAIKGAIQLKRISTDINGNYNLEGVDLSWFNQMMKINLNSQRYIQESSLEKFKANLRNQFGFDNEIINLIVRISSEISNKFPSLSQSERDRLLLVSLGNFVYQESYGELNNLFDESKVVINNWSWEDVAGPTYPGLKSEDVINTTMFLNELGIDDVDIAKLRYHIRLQSQVSSGQYTVYEMLDDKDKVLYREKYNNVFNESLTKEEFNSKWNGMFKIYEEKIDFAHFSITTSANLNHRLRISDISQFSHEKVNDFAGWLGDSTLTDAGRINFGNDDYKADLDSVNITQLMKEKRISFIEASNEYYSELSRGEYTRAEKFVEYKPIKEVKDSIFKELIPDSMIIKDGPGLNVTVEFPAEEKYMDYIKKKYSDTYRFIQSLEKGLNELLR